MPITLRSGRLVYIGELHQRVTYAGLLAGLPDASMNRGRTEARMGEARGYGVADAEPYLIPPKIVVRERVSRGTTTREERLPAVSCIAVLTSGELARENSDPHSSLTVVWFQDEFALPIAADVEESVRGIDWETKATDWCW